MEDRMRNLWVTRDDPIAGWVADLTPLQPEPQVLLDWLQKVLAEGERCEVFKVRAAPLADYVWAKDGPLASYLRQSFADTGVVDLFHFSTSQLKVMGDSQFQALARMAYFDAEGRLAEADVADLGLLLRSVRPADFEVNWGLFHRCFPLLITGPKVALGNLQPAIAADKPEAIRVRFRIFSDIWFPWVLGFLEDSFDVNRMYDNRLLSERHTPRLNRFLSFVSDLTKALGGTWQLDQEESNTVSAFMLADEGIRFDVEPPAVWPIDQDSR
ncbi:MAG: hypothetical protein QOD33_958 [Pyrinomonadaceae bacterium]|jgi:hypothetical protein|nr:hypothetical protein [Pyrinomonadaceae bacterium]